MKITDDMKIADYGDKKEHRKYVTERKGIVKPKKKKKEIKPIILEEIETVEQDKIDIEIKEEE